MEVNSPLEILSGLAVMGGIVGFVIYDSHLTVRGAVDLALQNPLIAAAFGLIALLISLFGKGGGGTGGMT